MQNRPSTKYCDRIFQPQEYSVTRTWTLFSIFAEKLFQEAGEKGKKYKLSFPGICFNVYGVPLKSFEV